jgi:hypothetical protein
MSFRHCWLALGLGACASAEEPPRVELPVGVGGGGIATVQTNLGYEVTLSEARLVIDDVEFAIAGETHAASLWKRSMDWLIPAAHAHPGHYQGGDITGELLGHFVLDLLGNEDNDFGLATLIVGRYQSSNFTFGVATRDDVAPGDPLLGHTAVLRGRAVSAERSVDFSVALDAFPARQLVGAPFDATVSESGASSLALELMTLDPLEGDTLFDDIPFADLPASTTGLIEMGGSTTDVTSTAAYNTLRRTFQTHDHFRFVARPSG